MVKFFSIVFRILWLRFAIYKYKQPRVRTSHCISYKNMCMKLINMIIQTYLQSKNDIEYNVEYSVTICVLRFPCMEAKYKFVHVSATEFGGPTPKNFC